MWPSLVGEETGPPRSAGVRFGPVRRVVEDRVGDDVIRGHSRGRVPRRGVRPAQQRAAAEAARGGGRRRDDGGDR
eukprot:7693750-Pyramimonas_sp.AAC.1